MEIPVVQQLPGAAAGKRVSILSCQLRSEPRSNEANLERLLGLMERAPAHSTVVTPELFLSGYVRADVAGLALALESPALQRLRQACARLQLSLIVGFVEQEQERFYNSLLVIDEAGSDVHCYRKTHLYPGEEEGFTAGDELAVFELNGVRIGLLNCYEIELPEPARALLERGCEMLITASANMWPYFRDHQVAAVARALENRVHHVYVNQVGQGETMTFVGGSRWVRPDGTVGFEAEAHAEDVTAIAFELQGLRPGQADFLASRRAELY